MDDARIKKLRDQLKKCCFIDHPADLLYLTGLELSKGRLFISPTTATLFVDGRYYEKAKQEAPCAVAKWDEQKKLTEPSIAFDSANVTYEGYLALKKMHPQIDWIPLPNPVKKLRAIKDNREIAALKKAAHLTAAGIQKLTTLFKEGVTEEELAFEFEFFCRKHGASGLSFASIVAFGENSAYPHYRAGKTRLKKGDTILIDVGAVVDRYCGDMTRVFHFGEPDPRLVHFETLVQQAQKKAIEHIKPGAKCGTIDQIVHNEFAKSSVKQQCSTPKNGAFSGGPDLNVKQQYSTPKNEAFSGGPDLNVKQLYTHSLGHGIGLEAHEFPRLRFDGEDKDALLEPGMVITIEPGLYQPGLGGIRIEDMILVTETGYEKLFTPA